MGLYCAIAQSQEMAIAPELQAEKMSTLLAFDRNLKKRSNGNIRIGILYAFTDSKGFMNKLREWLVSDKAKNKFEMDVSVNLIRYESALQLQKELQKHPYSALYIMPELQRALSSITQLTRRLDVPTLGGNPAFAGLGVAVTLVSSGERIEPVVNVRAARAEGMDLPAAVLQSSDIEE